MSVDMKIAQFLQSRVFAVAGVSTRPEKFGNKVFKCYQKKGYRVIPIHPVEKEIEGVACVASVTELPDEVVSLSVVTPPAVTEKLVVSAAAKGIRNIWMQPGAESPSAVAFCEQQGINVIADGTCVLVRFDCHH
ncbi:MAG: CoA-binding protein [Desulfuromonadales bacterium]|nr:CoA-binding protein [Desulfuromonadales bacterium]